VALLEPSKSDVQIVSDVFKDDRKGFFDGASEQSLKSSSDEGQGAGQVGIAQQALVLDRFFVGRLGASLNQLVGFGEVTGCGIGSHGISEGVGGRVETKGTRLLSQSVFCPPSKRSISIFHGPEVTF
jgi:hypothetical protein